MRFLSAIFSLFASLSLTAQEASMAPNDPSPTHSDGKIVVANKSDWLVNFKAEYRAWSNFTYKDSKYPIDSTQKFFSLIDKYANHFPEIIQLSAGALGDGLSLQRYYGTTGKVETTRAAIRSSLLGEYLRRQPDAKLLSNSLSDYAIDIETVKGRSRNASESVLYKVSNKHNGETYTLLLPKQAGFLTDPRAGSEDLPYGAVMLSASSVDGTPRKITRENLKPIVDLIVKKSTDTKFPYSQYQEKVYSDNRQSAYYETFYGLYPEELRPSEVNEPNTINMLKKPVDFQLSETEYQSLRPLEK